MKFLLVLLAAFVLAGCFSPSRRPDPNSQPYYDKRPFSSGITYGPPNVFYDNNPRRN